MSNSLEEAFAALFSAGINYIEEPTAIEEPAEDELSLEEEEATKNNRVKPAFLR